MDAPFLIGTKVYLRAWERGDATAVVAWLNDPEVTRTLAIRRPMNVAAEEAWIDAAYASERDLPLAIVAKNPERLIGGTGLHQIDFADRHATFGIFIGAKEEWGKGYGAETTVLMVRHAFATLNLNRVWLKVYEYNQPGIRVYEKAGFRREGVLRQDHFHDGRYWDSVIMAVLRDEWESPPGGR